MTKLTIALAQMDIALGNPATNVATVRQFAGEAAGKGADLLVLPELWSTGYDLERAQELAVSLDDGSFHVLAELAQEHHITIAGSILTRNQGLPRNTATLYGVDGSLRAAYSKIHLFGLMQEDRYLGAGDDAPIFELDWGCSAFAICYDLRFPELFRSYAVRGAALIIVPAEWPHPRLEHWRTLVQARAIEDQCFIVACNRVGEDRNNRFCGHSLVVDPWGTILVEGEEEACLLLAEIDLGLATTVRTRMSVLRDRRPELYS